MTILSLSSGKSGLWSSDNGIPKIEEEDEEEDELVGSLVVPKVIRESPMLAARPNQNQG